MRTPQEAETFLVGLRSNCDSFPNGFITYFRVEWNENQSIFKYLKNEKHGSSAQDYILEKYPGYRSGNYPSSGSGNKEMLQVENVSELIEVAKNINQKEPDTSIQYVIVYEVEKGWNVWNTNGINIPIAEKTIKELFEDITALGYDLINDLISIGEAIEEYEGEPEDPDNSNISLVDSHEEKLTRLIKLTRIVKRKVGDQIT